MPPAREDVVAYLKAHLTEFPVEELRRQLATEGVSETEFDDALKSTLRAPGGAVKPAPAVKKPSGRALAGKLVLAVGLLSIALAVLLAVRGSGDVEKAAGPKTAAASAASAYVGRAGWVVRLPAGYAATPSTKNGPQVESLFFHRAGLDPSSLLDEGLYGPLGIVRLEVQPDPFANMLSPVDTLTAATTAKARERGEKFSSKPVLVNTLKGVQLTYDAPHARVETFVVGQHALYAFYAGQDDEVFREILLSLRDSNSEN